jgi:hypothetical protein
LTKRWLSLLPCPDIGDFVSTNEEFLEYADQSSPESCIQALLALDSFIEEEGPFDAVMAFSQGAALASSLMIYRLRKDPERESASPTFRSAVFFSGGPPEDPSDITSGSRRVMNYQANGEIIGIPTVHIWGKYDQLYPTFGPVLSKLCKASDREESIHDGGHEIPGPRDQVAVARTVQLIKRTIGRTVEA